MQIVYIDGDNIAPSKWPEIAKAFHLKGFTITHVYRLASQCNSTHRRLCQYNNLELHEIEPAYANSVDFNIVQALTKSQTVYPTYQYYIISNDNGYRSIIASNVQLLKVDNTTTKPKTLTSQYVKALDDFMLVYFDYKAIDKLSVMQFGSVASPRLLGIPSMKSYLRQSARFRRTNDHVKRV